MLGAIAGDIIGSVYEARPVKSKDFPLFPRGCTFTDDTVLTVAVADAILNNSGYTDKFHEYFERYPYAGFGGSFMHWAMKRLREPYYSFGNGSAMRVSPVGFAFDELERVLAEAEKSAAVTHNHPEGTKGAQATASAVFLAKTGAGKKEIRDFVAGSFGYRLEEPLEDIRKTYRFDVTCQGSVPQSVIAFLEGKNWEDAVRNAVSLGGDADTMAAIAGAIAEAYYGMPENIAQKALSFLDDALIQVVDGFAQRFMVPYKKFHYYPGNKES
ncbi:MAG: ADP-ribosylglycohydrolase family protein [Desulfobacteraceae bacterium]|nr:ADP-ribosylglycohydrolase family protein [Desulfobacteraceae bacterium]